MSQPHSIPRPLVRLNQWTILLSVILTWVTGVFWILAIPLVANILGILCNFNPIIRVGKLFLKNAPSTYIPEDAQQQKFNFFQQKSPTSISGKMGFKYICSGIQIYAERS